jgi:thioesterase domain-containing protein
MQRVQPVGPYLIAGVCTGGLVAYEIAQQLAAKGDHATVFMLDTWHPDSYVRYRHKWFGHMFMTGVVLEKIVADLRGIIRRPPTEWWPDLTRKSKVLFSLFSQSMTEHIQDQDFQIQRLTQATFLAVAHYHVRRFAGPVVNIVASRRRVDDVIPDTRHHWAHLGNKDSCTFDIPAENSGRLLVSPYVEQVVTCLRPYLRPDPPKAEIDRGHQSGHPA